MSKLQDELREKVAALADRSGYNYSAARLRGEPVRTGYDAPGVVAAAEAVIALLDDYEEVGVEDCTYEDARWLTVDRGTFREWQANGTRTTALVRKTEKRVTVSREDAALLMEFVKDAPRHSPELDAAADRVKKATGG